MSRYEVLFLVRPTVTSDEIASIESLFAKTVKDREATLISYERWGKYRLAYPIEGHEYGIYCLARFEVLPAQQNGLLDALKTLLAVKFNTLVLRSVFTRLDIKASLEYSRPSSLEEGPAREGGNSYHRNNQQAAPEQSMNQEIA